MEVDRVGFSTRSKISFAAVTATKCLSSCTSRVVMDPFFKLVEVQRSDCSGSNSEVWVGSCFVRIGSYFVPGGQSFPVRLLSVLVVLLVILIVVFAD